MRQLQYLSHLFNLYLLMQLLLFSTDSFFLSYYPHTGNHCTCQSFSVVSDVKSSLVTKGDE